MSSNRRAVWLSQMMANIPLVENRPTLAVGRARVVRSIERIRQRDLPVADRPAPAACSRTSPRRPRPERAGRPPSARVVVDMQVRDWKASSAWHDLHNERRCRGRRRGTRRSSDRSARAPSGVLKMLSHSAPSTSIFTITCLPRRRSSRTGLCIESNSRPSGSVTQARRRRTQDGRPACRWGRRLRGVEAVVLMNRHLQLGRDLAAPAVVAGDPI